MRIERIGENLAVKDNQNRIKHITPYNGIFVHKHPFDSNFVLLSDRSKKSVKDAIKIKVSDVDKVGLHWVRNASRDILMIFLSNLLDDTKSILDTESYLDSHLLMNANADEFPLEYGEISNDPTHVFNSYDTSGAVLLLVDAPDDSFNFRITNGGLWGLWLKEGNEESIMTYTGNVNFQHVIAVGKTVSVSYDINTNLYTIVDI
jgi:hypothetical protein